MSRRCKVLPLCTPGRLVATALLVTPLVAAAQPAGPDAATATPPEGTVGAAPAAEPAAPPPAAAAQPTAETAAADAASDKPKDKPAELAQKLGVGKTSGAWFQPGLLAQGWFFTETTQRAGADGSDVTVSSSSFRVRRAEISVGGEIIPKAVKYKVMIDPARVRDTLTSTTAVDADGKPVTIKAPSGAVSTLQDFYITFVSELADVSIGQFKIPVSWEGVNSSSKLILPERAFVANLLGDKRDLGVRIEKTFEKWGYMAGVWNGAGLNNLDNNNQKDGALRLEVYPVKGLTIAGVTYDSIGYRQRAGTKDRWEADVRYDHGPILFQSEYLRARDVGAGGKVSTSHGVYAAFAYKLAKLGSGPLAGELQPVVRVGYFDPDTSGDVDPAMVPSSKLGGNDERYDYEVGLNYYVRKHEMKFQASYDRQQFDQKTANNVVVLATQVQF